MSRIACVFLYKQLITNKYLYLRPASGGKEKLMKSKTTETLDLEKARELLIRNITFCLNKCNDISLLDLIYKLLKKSM